MANPVLKISVNRNKTKEGVKVQFVFPTNIEGDQKAEMTQKLQSKLNAGLGKFGLTINQDTDVPFSNVIGFLIPIADFKIMIKNAIGGGGAEAPAPEAAPEEEMPVSEEPVKEIKRMQELAGLKEDEYVGVLGKEEYKDDEVYYVNIPKLGNIILSNKLIDTLGEEELNTLIGKEKKWNIIEDNPLTKNTQGKYRVVGIK